ARWLPSDRRGLTGPRPPRIDRAGAAHGLQGSAVDRVPGRLRRAVAASQELLDHRVLDRRGDATSQHVIVDTGAVPPDVVRRVLDLMVRCIMLDPLAAEDDTVG